MGMRLSIVVPAYNEERRLGGMLDDYLPFFASRFGDAFELIVVVNGSSDGTAALAARYAAQWPVLRVIVEPASIGKGGAVMLGLRVASGACAGYVDADGSTPASAFLDLVERVSEERPAVIASRWCRGASVSPPQPPLRRFASRVFNLFTRGLFGLRLHDTQCGAKVFHRRALEHLLNSPGFITRWAFDVDLLFRIRREQIPIIEVPTVWHDVEGSKLTVTETSLEMLAALVRLRLMYSPLRWIATFYDRFLIGGGETEESLRRSLLFGIGGQAVNIFNLAFQVMVAHVLLSRDGGEAGAYGDMAAALSGAALLNAVFGRASGERVQKREPGVGNGNDVAGTLRFRLLRKSVKSVLLSMALVVFALQAGRISVVFRLESPWLVYLALALGVVQIYQTMQTAALGTMGNGRSATLLNVLHSMLRVAVAGALLALGCGVAGALGGALAGAAIAGGAAALLAGRMRGAGGGAAVQGWCWGGGGFDWRFVLPMLGFALLNTADVLMIKIRFAPAEAGEYALAAMMAKMVFFLPMPLAAAAFSRAAESPAHSMSRRELVTILSSVLVPLLLIVVFAETVARLITGTAPGATVPLLRALAAAYTPLPLLFLLLNYGLSRRRFAVVALVLPLGGVVFALAVHLPAAVSRCGVAFALGTVNILCLLALAETCRRGWRLERTEQADGS